MESESSIDEHSSISEPCKKSKTAKSTSEERDDDIISRLPDEILTEILSHITTKEAVASSILSKRWGKIWTSVPILDFSDFHRTSGMSPLIETHFMEFVDNVFRLNRVPSVRKSHLRIFNKTDSSRVKAWINCIFTRDSEEIEFEMPRSYVFDNLDQTNSIYSVPDSFFTSKHLVQLSLEHAVLKIPESVSLPCLKTVFFFSVLLLDEASMKNFLLGCPVIQRLQINREELDDVNILYICSSTLHDLTLCNMYDDFGSKIAIDAPNLRRLDLIDDVGHDYDIIHLSDLARVEVDINMRIYPWASDFDVSNDRFFGLLRQISHVGNMHFGSGTVDSLSHALLERMPMFKNLIRMKVQLCSDIWPVLFHLFHCAPNLVTFVLGRNACGVFPGLGSYRPIQVPQCFLSSLKYVVIRNFEDPNEDMEIIKYFLESAVVLKKMSVVMKKITDDSCIKELEKQMLILPMSSSQCVCDIKNPSW